MRSSSIVPARRGSGTASGRASASVVMTVRDLSWLTCRCCSQARNVSRDFVPFATRKPIPMPLAPFSFGPTTPVVFGVDRSRKLAQDIAGLGVADRPVLLVADPALGALADSIAEQLGQAGIRVGRFNDVRS